MSHAAQRLPVPKGLCLFCGNRADSTEDVLPKWMQALIVAEIPEGARTVSTIVDGAAPGGPRTLHRWYAAKPEVLTNDVCQRCNTGWMSRIESAVIPLVSPMIAGERGRLSPDEQHTVARWLALKGVLTLHTREGEENSSEWVAKFYAEKDIPVTWHARLARVTMPYQAHFSSASVTLTERHFLAPFPLNYHGIVCSVTAGHFFGQVIAFKGRVSSVRLNASHYVPIWPRAEVESRVGEGIDSEFNVMWPPKRSVNTSQLQKALANYFDPLM